MNAYYLKFCDGNKLKRDRHQSFTALYGVIFIGDFQKMVQEL